MPTPDAFLAFVVATACAIAVATTVMAMYERSRHSARIASLLVTLLALMSLVIIRAPYLEGYTANEGFATLVPFVIAVLWMLCQPKRKADRVLSMLIGGFVLLFAITLYRGKLAGVGTGGTKELLDQIGAVAVTAAFGVLLLTSAQNESETRQRLVAIALAPAVYVGVNVVLRAVGFSAPSVAASEASYPTGTQAKTLALFGIHTTRQAFPMNPSINGMGVVAAIGLVAAAVLAMRMSGAVRRAGLVGAGFCLVGLLLTDTRGGLLLAIAVVGLMALVKRPRVALLLAVVIPFSSWIIKSILSLSIWSSSGVASALSRGANDFATANGRTVIWQAAQHQLATTDLFHAVFGFGANGQATSGASQQYAYLFQDVAKPFLVHVHNVGLQMLLDMGILGLLWLVAIVVLAVSRLEAITRLTPSGPAPALLAAIVMIFLTGATEPSPTYRTQETLVYAVLILSATAGLARAPVRVLAGQLRSHTGKPRVSLTGLSASRSMQR